VGAVATNLSSSTARQDIYETVAETVRDLVATDVTAGIDEARAWHGKVTRKVVKRAVMTTPYGVTDRGIRDQLLFDGHVPSDDGIGKGDAAEYLKDKIVAALGSTVSSAKGIMAWLQVTADRLARAGLPFDWTTPTGSKVRQAYHVTTATRERTLAGQLLMLNEEREAGLNVRKQALGAAPNFIHSFDAAHLSLTVVEGHRSGVKAWAMIHDSYGTHAGRATRLAAILREQFVAIYSQNWLEKLATEIREYAPHVDLPDLPVRGAFAINQVLDAPFFFS
jgi:DNA-directed RNA polymerase